MKTIILAINAKYVHAALAPWYLRAAVRERNAREAFRAGCDAEHQTGKVPAHQEIRAGYVPIHQEIRAGGEPRQQEIWAADGGPRQQEIQAAGEDPILQEIRAAGGEPRHQEIQAADETPRHREDSAGDCTFASPLTGATAGIPIDLEEAEIGVLEEPEILEANINQPIEGLLSEILKRRPAVLAIGCYIWNIVFIEKLLVRLEEEAAACVLILGGPEVSYNGEERLAMLRMVDFIICGEGEPSFVPLLSYLQWIGQAVGGEGTKLKEILRHHAGMPKESQQRLPVGAAFGAEPLRCIPGLVWRAGGAVEQNPAYAGEGEPPDPYLPEFFTQIAGRIAYLETSRGCPFHCGFCLSGGPGHVRFFDMGKAKHRLVQLANAGVATVKLVDRTFNCHSLRCRELIRFLLEGRASGLIPQGVCFHFEVAGDLFDDETISLLEKAPAGLFQLEIGLQSFHEDVLEAVGRKTDIKRMKRNVMRLRKPNHIHLHLDLIAGLPEESFAAFGDSFDQAFALRPHMLQLGFLKLLHGSRLRDRHQAYGIEFDGQAPYRVRRTDWLSEAEMAEITHCEDALKRLYNSGRFPKTCAYLLGFYPSPFEMFTAIGKGIGHSAGMPLETYIAKLLVFGEGMEGVDREALRDCLVLDWLATNHSGVLPLSLQKRDPMEAKVGKALERQFGGKKKPPGLGTRRAYGFALLYGTGKTRLAIAEYGQPRPYLGNYPLRIQEVCEA